MSDSGVVYVDAEEDLDAVRMLQAMGWDQVVAAPQEGPDIGQLACRLFLAGTEPAVELVANMAAVPDHVDPEVVSDWVDSLHYPKTERLSPMEAAVLAYTATADDGRKFDCPIRRQG